MLLLPGDVLLLAGPDESGRSDGAPEGARSGADEMT